MDEAEKQKQFRLDREFRELVARNGWLSVMETVRRWCFANDTALPKALEAEKAD
jgi:hypothetical protein